MGQNSILRRPVDLGGWGPQDCESQGLQNACKQGARRSEAVWGRVRGLRSCKRRRALARAVPTVRGSSSEARETAGQAAGKLPQEVGSSGSRQSAWKLPQEVGSLRAALERLCKDSRAPKIA